MTKSRAEIQKAYRERKKAANREEFLEKERVRVHKYYVPAASLPASKLKTRNLNNKFINHLSRFRKRQLAYTEGSSGYVSSTGEETPGPSTRQTTPLVVKMPGIQSQLGSGQSAGPKKARSRALARAHKSLQLLRQDIFILKRKLNTKTKQLQRLSCKVRVPPKNLTPRTKTHHEVESLALTPSRKSKVKRKLLLANVIMEEVKATKEICPTKKRAVLHRMISGKVVKKYRCIRAISSSLGFSRTSLHKCKNKSLQLTREKRQCLSRRVIENVVSFLGREDNSRMQPGKADAKKCTDGKKHQTKVLTDYMRNLHQKFNAEHPDMPISLTTFCRLRPRHILLARYISRNACQCTRHQNIALKLQAIKKLGIPVTGNPESILEQRDIEAFLSDGLPDGDVTYKAWKMVETEKGRKMKVVEEKLGRASFIDLMKKEVEQFSSHVARVRLQYGQLKKLKEELPPHQMIVQMDFAENYICRSLDEVQTAYWNQTAVTLHPIVVYFKSEKNELKHKSFVVVSDVMSHSAGTVCSFLDAVIPLLKEIDKDLHEIHYWTDSPSSQYRNRYIFQAIMDHKEKYGIAARWNYFEAGHGKGPCDGVGGTTKRMADEAIRQGTCSIQDAQEFYEWAVSSTMKDIHFVFVPKDTCERKQGEFAQMVTKPVKNTMKLHAVVGTDFGKLLTRETSCYCDGCIMRHFCNSWTEVSVTTTSRNTVQTANEETHNLASNTNEIVESHPAPDSPQTNILPDVDSFIAALYDGQWYAGKVTNVDTEDGEVQVSFMEEGKSLYKWPQREDKIWIPKCDILCSISPPVATGKSKRFFRLSDEDKILVQALYVRKY